MNLRELAREWDVDPEPLLDALASAQRVRRFREGQKPLIASAEPAECKKRLKQAHKAIAALPLRARAHLHQKLAERIAYGPVGLDREQIGSLNQDTDLVELILAALSEPIEREEPDRELQWLVQAWVEAGGEILTDERHNPELVEFLKFAFSSLGDELKNDDIRLRLKRFLS